MQRKLWEILVPKYWNDGWLIELSHHRKWDEKVRAITGGMTILGSAKGLWVNPAGKLFEDRMIPVRIICTHAELDAIIDITLEHYPDQEAVMAYLVSEEVIIRRRNLSN